MPERSGAIPPLFTMNDTEQALAAIRLLQSLPDWERIASVYGNMNEHLKDMVDDLENNDWENLV